MMLKKVWMLD